MRGFTMRRIAALLTACIMALTALTGCNFKFSEPSVDMSAFTVCSEDSFITALETVGVPKEKHVIHRDHAFKFALLQLCPLL